MSSALLSVAGKHFVVTGGASGLGAAAVRRLVKENAKVTIFDLSEDHAKKLQKELPEGKTHFVKVNVAQQGDVAKGVSEAVSRFGEIRGCVHSAGICVSSPFVQANGQPHSFDLFKKVIDVNLFGAFNMLSVVAASMAKNTPENDERGSIVLVSSIAAFDAQIGLGAYCASKGAIVSLTLPAAAELGVHGIRVNSIAPGVFATPMSANEASEIAEALNKTIPFPKRMGKPEELADLAHSLLTNQYFNGGVYRIDGGLRMAAL